MDLKDVFLRMKSVSFEWSWNSAADWGRRFKGEGTCKKSRQSRCD